MLERQAREEWSELCKGSGQFRMADVDAVAVPEGLGGVEEQGTVAEEDLATAVEVERRVVEGVVSAMKEEDGGFFVVWAAPSEEGSRFHRSEEKRQSRIG